jgi:hypothetical protein
MVTTMPLRSGQSMRRMAVLGLGMMTESDYAVLLADVRRCDTIVLLHVPSPHATGPLILKTQSK